MKTGQLVEIENVKGANRVLNNLLQRTRTENVGIGLFYGIAGLGKTRWATTTARKNNFIYIRLEANVRIKDFLRELLKGLLFKTMSYYEPVGTTNELYNQALDFLQNEPDTTIMIDEIDYGFSNEKILATIRDLADQSLATFVLVGMERAKEKLKAMQAHYFDRCNAFYEFKPLNTSDVGCIVNDLCKIKVDNEIAGFIHRKSKGTMRLVNKYIDALEKIGSRMKKTELRFEEIKDILSRVEA